MRLLNYQNNLINKITNLANLPNLIFIDLYNNLIDTLEGPLSTMTALRVMMVGKNKIQKVSHRQVYICFFACQSAPAVSAALFILVCVCSRYPLRVSDPALTAMKTTFRCLLSR